MARLDKERQILKEPTRLIFAKNAIENLGYQIIFESEKELHFIFKKERVVLFPYTGWHTGKSIKDGRGITNLLNQIK